MWRISFCNTINYYDNYKNLTELERQILKTYLTNNNIDDNKMIKNTSTQRV